MPKTLCVFASSLFFILAAFSPDAVSSVVNGAQPPPSLVANSLHRSLYPGNVECKNFDKTGYKTWQLRDRSAVDLGNWDAAFPITGAIEPGDFVKNGLDLFDVLEIKCGLSA